MVYGYIRVSTDKQTLENQRFEICAYAVRENLGQPVWIEETISGTKDPHSRKLGWLLNRLKAGDMLICSELSRLGRSLFMIIDVLNFCLKRKIHVHTIKDNFHLGDDISSKVLAFAFGLSAEIERNLISQRTKEAMARKKAEGVRLGRPSVVWGRESEIRSLLEKHSALRTANLLGLPYHSVVRFVRLYVKKQPPDKGGR